LADETFHRGDATVTDRAETGAFFMLRKKVLICGLILVMGLLALVSCSFYFCPNADFTAVEFDNEYKDWKAADARYFGKTLSIRGKVLDVAHGGGMMTPHGWTLVTIGEGPSGVLCNFPTEVVYQTKYLVRGQVIVIRGECAGSVGCPVLTKCTIVGTDLPQTIGGLWK